MSFVTSRKKDKWREIGLVVVVDIVVRTGSKRILKLEKHAKIIKQDDTTDIKQSNYHIGLCSCKRIN